MDDDAWPPMFEPLGVLEQAEEAFARCHIEHVRFFISARLLHEQRSRFRARTGQSEADDEDAKDELAEFELELANFHELLVNPYLEVEDVLNTVRASLERYVAQWPHALETHARWWSERKDKTTAVQADLQLVVPGMWIGSSVTVKYHWVKLSQKGIRHVVYCCSTKPDNDADYLQGTQWAKDTGHNARAAQYPRIELATTELNEFETIKRHTITLFELGRMEFLVRRREKTLHSGADAMESIVHTLDRLLSQLQERQHDRAIDNQQNDVERLPFLDSLDGILLYCDSGFSTSITVCAALLMFRLEIPVRIAMALINTARAYVQPTHHFHHQLHEYESSLEERRVGRTFPIKYPPIA